MAQAWQTGFTLREGSMTGWIEKAGLVRKLAAWACAGMLAWAAPTLAKDGPIKVDVELVFTVDVSYSMDPEEQRLQRDGYVQAITSPEFLKALEAGAYGKIAVAYVQWASAFDQDMLVPWTLIDGPASARAFAEKLTEAPYRRARRTSISGAIDFAMKSFENNGFSGVRRVIDVSGDGTNNDGRPVERARDDAINEGVTINGLPLLIRPSNWGYVDIANLDEYYEDCVIGGPGAFVIPIKDREHFIKATKTKLIMEIAYPLPAIGDGTPSTMPAQQREPRVSCMVGENMWRDRWGR
jgi:hypothetical protein